MQIHRDCQFGQGVDTAKRLLPEAIQRCVGCVSSMLITRKGRFKASLFAQLTSATRDTEILPTWGMGLTSLGLEPMIIPGEGVKRAHISGVSLTILNHRILVADSPEAVQQVGCWYADRSAAAQGAGQQQGQQR